LGKERTTSHCCFAVMLDHATISSSVRLQPIQTLWSFSVHTSLQGEAGKPGRGGRAGTVGMNNPAAMKSRDYATFSS
jgi:hypothetical protein